MALLGTWLPLLWCVDLSWLLSINRQDTRGLSIVKGRRAAAAKLPPSFITHRTVRGCHLWIFHRSPRPIWTRWLGCRRSCLKLGNWRAPRFGRRWQRRHRVIALRSRLFSNARTGRQAGRQDIRLTCTCASFPPLCRPPLDEYQRFRTKTDYRPLKILGNPIFISSSTHWLSMNHRGWSQKKPQSSKYLPRLPRCIHHLVHEIHAIAPFRPPTLYRVIIIQPIVLNQTKSRNQSYLERKLRQDYIPRSLCFHCSILFQRLYTTTSCIGVSALKGVLFLAFLFLLRTSNTFILQL